MSPKYEPQQDCEPILVELQVGTALTRIHDSSYGATAFMPAWVSLQGERDGRFDCTANDSYGYLYAASDDVTAVAETLLREWPDSGYRSNPLGRSTLDGRSISFFEPKSNLRLVSLRSGPDLGAIGQDTWLTTSPSTDYQDTRIWSSAIRRWAPDAVGLTWHSRFNPPGHSYIFFLDRCGPNDFGTTADPDSLLGSTSPIGTGNGFHHICRILGKYRVPVLLDR